MIRSFRGDDARRIFEGGRSRRFANIQSVVERKLLLLDTATTLQDLASPPNNRLEALKRDRIGQHSIRINDQFRLCFRWREGSAYDVEIVDYH